MQKNGKNRKEGKGEGGDSPARSSMNHGILKARQRAERQTHPQNLALRVHRALSWLSRAEQAGTDVDAQFIFLWIAFNAAYATEIDERYRTSESEAFREFMQKLISLDKARLIEQLVWKEFTGSIRLLLDNPFIFQDFWNFHTGKMIEKEWMERFASARKAAGAALKKGNTAVVLSVVLSRIYTLRNQVMHGGATWNGAVNRDQLRDCVKLMGKLVPAVIEIMLNNVDTLWGDACYPVVGE